MTTTARRTYDASRRRAMAATNRAAVLEAAAELFATRGWAAGMRDVARLAQVSVETVYATAGSKAELLLQVVELGSAGERVDWAALARGDRDQRMADLTRWVTESHQAVAELSRTFAHAASADPALAGHWEEYDAGQRARFAAGARYVLGRRPSQDLVDGLWALGSAEVYLRLTETAGWSPEKYRRWLTERVDQLFP
ncbi:TetR/AcrR family transcriptional regulator [Nocardioides caricicola]|uniref:TetR/AcrR family transcriptional regulator n=1 Tax=Nocardioides caricicola TaxID=634770 RepID=A0ABW0N7Y4_9ACTN